jgi:hypothetical protein
MCASVGRNVPDTDYFCSDKHATYRNVWIRNPDSDLNNLSINFVVIFFKVMHELKT